MGSHRGKETDMQKFFVHVRGQYIATVESTIEQIKQSFPYSEINKSGSGWHVNIFAMPKK
jgi:hypothetical protein